MMRTYSVSVTFLLFFSLPVLADQISLKNGDRISGTIVSSDEKVLTLKTQFMGTISIQVGAIDQILSDQPLYLVLKDNQTLMGTVSTSANQMQVKTADAGSVTVARDSILALRSKEAQSAYQAELDRLRNPGLADLWKGTADAGLSLTRGNSSTTSINLAMNAARTTTRDKTSVYFTSLYAKNSTTGVSLITANAVRGGARYDLNLTKRLFAFGTGDLEFDEFQKLDLRVVLGGGLGWKAFTDERTTLSLFGGGLVNKEYFSTGLKRTSGEALIGEELTYSLSSRSSFRERASFSPNLSESGEYRFTFDASAVTNLNTWLGWHVTFSDRYLSNPVPGTKSNDVLLTTGLRVTFGK